MKKVHTLGNSLVGGNRRSLNISQQFGDSSINDGTLAKTKVNQLNLSSLLKSNILDDDGIEDLHFYFVSFNQHKKVILKQHEDIESKAKSNVKQQQPKIKGPHIKGMNVQKNNEESKSNNNKTIESIDNEDLF